MVIKICLTEQQLQSLDEGWLNQQVNRRRRDGESVCVRVEIDEPPLSITLATAECVSGGGFSRALTREEQAVLDLWRKHHLSELEFHPGDLIAFLKQLRRIVG